MEDKFTFFEYAEFSDPEALAQIINEQLEPPVITVRKVHRFYREIFPIIHQVMMTRQQTNTYFRKLNALRFVLATNELTREKQQSLQHEMASIRNTLVDSLCPLIAKLAYRNRRSIDQNAEAISEALLFVTKGIHRFDARLGFSLGTYVIWLVRSGMHAYTSQLRRRRPINESVFTGRDNDDDAFGLFNREDPRRMIDDERTQRQQREFINHLLNEAEISDNDRETMRLYFGLDGRGNMTQCRVAGILGVSHGAIYQRIQKVVHVLRDSAAGRDIPGLPDFYIEPKASEPEPIEAAEPSKPKPPTAKYLANLFLTAMNSHETECLISGLQINKDGKWLIDGGCELVRISSSDLRAEIVETLGIRKSEANDVIAELAGIVPRAN